MSYINITASATSAFTVNLDRVSTINWRNAKKELPAVKKDCIVLIFDETVVQDILFDKFDIKLNAWLVAKKEEVTYWAEELKCSQL